MGTEDNQKNVLESRSMAIYPQVFLLVHAHLMFSGRLWIARYISTEMSYNRYLNLLMYAIFQDGPKKYESCVSFQVLWRSGCSILEVSGGAWFFKTLKAVLVLYETLLYFVITRPCTKNIQLTQTITSCPLHCPTDNLPRIYLRHNIAV